MAWIAAIAAIAGSVIASDASGSAASTQANAATQAGNTSAAAQLQALGDIQAVESPYSQVGLQALGQYSSLLGLGPISAGLNPATATGYTAAMGGGGGAPAGAPAQAAPAGQAPTTTDANGNPMWFNGSSWVSGTQPAGGAAGGPATGAQAATAGRSGLGVAGIQPLSAAGGNAAGLPGGGPFSNTPSTVGGATGPSANFDPNQIPGFSQANKQALAGVEGSYAGGGALSGNMLQGLYTTGQSAAYGAFQNYLSELAGLSGLGQAAASNTASQMGSLIPGAGASIAGGINAAGQANSAGTIAQTNALIGGLNNPAIQSGAQSLFAGGGGAGEAPMGNLSDQQASLIAGGL